MWKSRLAVAIGFISNYFQDFSEGFKEGGGEYSLIFKLCYHWSSAVLKDLSSWYSFFDFDLYINVIQLPVVTGEKTLQITFNTNE